MSSKMILFLAFFVAVIVIASGLNGIVTVIQTRGPQALKDLQRMSQTPYRSQEDCQERTGAICNYQTCDYVPPGKTFEEVCGVDFSRGWHASKVEISQPYRDAAKLFFIANTRDAQDELLIDRRASTIRYRAQEGNHLQTTEATPIDTHGVTLLVNKMILYNFLDMQKFIPSFSPTTTPMFAVTMVSKGADSTSTSTVRCAERSCTRNFTDIQSDFLRLWGKPLIGIG